MIHKQSMRELILQFRARCVERYPDDIDPVSSEKRAARFQESMPDSLVRMLQPGGNALTVPSALALIARTPRILKLIFRRVWEIWESLHGQVDFDDLLVINTLRYGAPQAFEFLQNHIDDIRALQFERPRPLFDESELRRYLDQAWAEALKKAVFNPYAARKLVDFLVPIWTTSGAQSSPQGVQNSGPTDYWQRAISEQIGSGEIRDQEVLRAIREWSQYDGNDDKKGILEESLEALCSDKRYTDVFEHFAGDGVLDGKKIRSLASLVFRRMRARYGVGAHADICPGFISLWRLAIHEPINESAHESWVVNELSKSVNVSLRLANDIYYYWRYNARAEMPQGRAGRTRSRYIEVFRSHFDGQPERFVNILDPSFMYSAYHFSVLYDSEEEGGPGFDGAKWRWFANLLLDAAYVDAQVVVPQLVTFVVSEKRNDYTLAYSPNQELARSMFGHNLSLLLDILKTDIDLTPFDERERARIRTAQNLTLDDLLTD